MSVTDNSTKSTLLLDLADAESSRALGVWLSMIIEPYYSEIRDASLGTRRTPKNMELEISFGRFHYFCRKHLYPFTIPENLSDFKIPLDIGTCLEMPAPWDRVIHDDWTHTKADIQTVSVGDFIAEMLPAMEEYLQLGDGSSGLRICAISDWTCGHYASMDPKVTKEDLDAASTNQNRIRFEKLRLYHTDTTIPETIWCLDKKTADFFKTTHTFSKERYTSSSAVHKPCSVAIVLCRKNSTAVTPFISARSLALSKAKSVSNLEQIVAAPWAVDNVKGVLKRKVAIPTEFASRFICLMDFAIYANTEEMVIPIVSKDEGCSSFLSTMKDIFDTSVAVVQPSQDNSGDENRNTCHPTNQLRSVIVNHNTHLPPYPIVSCRKSVYLAGPNGKDIVWRLDLSLCWRRNDETSNVGITHSLSDYLVTATHIKTLLQQQQYQELMNYVEKLKFDNGIVPVAEIEVECVNLDGLMTQCNGEYEKVAQNMISTACVVQKLLGKFKTSPNNGISSDGSIQLVPHAAPSYLYHLKTLVPNNQRYY